MTDALKSKTPKPAKRAALPDTHAQTQKVEQTLSPPHNTTEPYGKAAAAPDVNPNYKLGRRQR